MTDTGAVAAPQAPAPDPGAEPPPDAREAESFAGRVAAVARHVDRLRDRTGERGQLAELRRMAKDARGVPPAVFWETILRFGVSPREEELFRGLLPLMAVHPHDPKTSVGAALEAAGVTPARLERWLRADADDARTQAPRLLERLGERGINWVPLAYLLRDWGDEQRTAVARDFFRSRYLRTSANKGA